ncbi:hypothetical protein BH20GEM3_BH20GEM3_10830 [soil metagenome]
MNDRLIGMLLVAGGLAVVAVGLLVLSGGFGWFGRLPGDLRWERGGVRVYAPLASMLLVSAGLSMLLYLARRFF